MQFTVSDVGDNVAIGIYCGPAKVGSPGAVTTFVVADMTTARDALIQAGVQVGPIYQQRTGEGDIIYEAWFSDPDGNQFGLRQDEMIEKKSHDTPSF